MNKFNVYWLVSCLVIFGSCWVLVNSPDCAAQVLQPEISWGKITTLILSGGLGETQTGEIEFTIQTGSERKEFLVKITGTEFTHGNSRLDTYYFQPGCESEMHRAGEPFWIWCTLGRPTKIAYKAITGSRISAQPEGEYTGSLSISIKR